LSPEFGEINPSYENISDYYFPSEFRPYILVLPEEFIGSNYWFEESNVELIDYRNIPVIREVGSKTNDIILRSIFSRALTGIKEQTKFVIYPFYQIKVKATKM
jgi:hypothetical protein